MSIPYVEVAGSPRERGLAHGQALRESIERGLGFYFAVIGQPDDVLNEVGEQIRAGVHAHSPTLCEEIDAIAEAVGAEAWRLHVLNARSELMSGTADGCTAVFAPEAQLLGQNWDFAEQLEELVVVMKIEREDGHRILTVTEPGMVGKIGLNTAGVGVCLNFLFCPGPLRGVPVHVLLRDVMEASDLEEARGRVDKAAPGQSGNVLIGSTTGRGFDIELVGDERTFHPIEAEPFAHTNHHLWYDIDPGPVAASSKARLDVANARIADGGVSKLDDLRALLSDQSHPTLPICTPYTEFMYGIKFGTICTVLMDLAAGTMQVRRSPDPAAGFESYAL